MVAIPEITKKQFDIFLARASGLGLERVKGDKSDFPKDFLMVYKSKYLLNFEFLAGEGLEFYIVGVVEKGSQRLFKKPEEIKTSGRLLLCLKKKIEQLERGKL